MNQRLRDVLSGKGGNYLMPFFWQHGESEKTIRQYMGIIQGCGIGAVCIESRPHPDFCGPRWWATMDVIMEEARNRAMEVWVLDDSHFPTGYCNGLVKSKYPEDRKRFLEMTYIDAVGPRGGMRFTYHNPLVSVKNIFSAEAAAEQPPAEPLGAVAVQGEKRIILNQITAEGKLLWDLPPGHWRIYLFYETRPNPQNPLSRPDHVNLLSPRAGDILIEAVYEPHYQRYRGDFGKTFRGFFSDETELGNVLSGYAFDYQLGKSIPLPWSPELREELKSDMIYWPDFWDQHDEAGREFRVTYMNRVTTLVRENFTRKLEEWCALRGVEHIGHVLEDNGVHTATGVGMGHYFRAMEGYAMGGVDVVLNQLLPGLDAIEDMNTMPAGPKWNGEFFHYELAKLGSSSAHLHPEKKGRSMVEIFGAFGWHEGLRLEKWLADHFLVRGVNHFVPHAFSMAEFPDRDCPPHFYAQGKNIQFPWFGRLMSYINRMAHLLNGGRELISLAVLYPAELEWCGKSYPLRHIAKHLTRALIDFDIVPGDLLDTLHHRVLLVPRADYYPPAIREKLAAAESRGISIEYVDDANIAGVLQNLRERGIGLSLCKEQQDYLRAMIYIHEGRDGGGALDVYFLFNEHPCESMDLTLTLPPGAVQYDPMENRLIEKNGDRITLLPYESRIYVSGDLDGAALSPAFIPEGQLVIGDTHFTLDRVPRRAVLDLGMVHETAVVRINGQTIGCCISTPYRLEVPPDCLKPGQNTLEVQVVSTMNHQMPLDFFSLMVAEEPAGWSGEAVLYLAGPPV
jgi:hypothetical protein